MDDLRYKITLAINEFDESDEYTSYKNLFDKLNIICTEHKVMQSKNLLIKHDQYLMMINSIKERGRRTIVDEYFIAIDNKFIKLKYTQRFDIYECKGGNITEDDFYENIKNEDHFQCDDVLPNWVVTKQIMMKSARF